jgi:predicted RNase H-like nuclease
MSRCGRLPADLAEAGNVPAGILDAAAAAWTATRIARGQATSLPDPPQPGEAGQSVAIWC